MRRFRMLALGASVLALTVSACSTGGGSSSSASASAAGKPTVTIGSANFYESALVGEIYAQALEAKGFTVNRKFNFGTRALTNAALKSGQLNLMPEYIGSDAAELRIANSVLFLHRRRRGIGGNRRKSDCALDLPQLLGVSARRDRVHGGAVARRGARPFVLVA